MQQLLGFDRAAYYITVLVLLKAADDPSPLIAEGRWHGTIATRTRGRRGFGYDPLFVPKGLTRHAGEMTLEEKAGISHRAIAVRRLMRELDEN